MCWRIKSASMRLSSQGEDVDGEGGVSKSNAIEFETMLRQTRVVDEDRPYAISVSTNPRVSDRGFREQKQSGTFRAQRTENYIHEE